MWRKICGRLDFHFLCEIMKRNEWSAKGFQSYAVKTEKQCGNFNKYRAKIKRGISRVAVKLTHTNQIMQKARTTKQNEIITMQLDCSTK